MATRNMRSYDLYWSPTGQRIGTVTASTKRAAIRKAPKPYSRYKGEIYAEEAGSRGNPYEGDWIPCHAVRPRPDGGFDLMTEKRDNPGRTAARLRARGVRVKRSC